MFYEASTTPIPKPDNDFTREESSRTISFMDTDAKKKKLNKILAQQIW